jgi:tetratricopeptide (TPR) repeat protein
VSDGRAGLGRLQVSLRRGLMVAMAAVALGAAGYLIGIPSLGGVTESRESEPAEAIERALERRRIVEAMRKAEDEARRRADVKAAADLVVSGRAYADKGENDRAIQDYDQAIKLDPESANALFLRGVVRRMKGDGRGGDADIAKAKEIRADIVDYWEKRGVRP